MLGPEQAGQSLSLSSNSNVKCKGRVRKHNEEESGDGAVSPFVLLKHSLRIRINVTNEIFGHGEKS